MSEAKKSTISSIELINHSNAPVPPYVEKEQQQAIRHMLATNIFRPHNDNNGPYDIKLSIEENRLLIRIRNATCEDLNMLVLSLKPYRRLIQDYFLMMESYEQARQSATREKLEAIDMGRRGIHNEGADLLMERLQDKIEIDHETARRFFTLICALHKTHVRIANQTPA